MSIDPGSDTAGPATHTGKDVNMKFVSIKVNGAQIQVSERVTVRKIVERASEAGAISGVIEEYVIERVETVGEHGLKEVIEVQELEEFMAIPVSKTEVATMAHVHERIREELEALGYPSRVVTGDTSGGLQTVVVFQYRVPTGRFKGSRCMMGISTQCEAVGYPEIPPHWLFISPPITDTRDGTNHGLNKFGGMDWVALSRPPGAFWDKLGTKNMKGYMEHVARVWKHI